MKVYRLVRDLGDGIYGSAFLTPDHPYYVTYQVGKKAHGKGGSMLAAYRTREQALHAVWIVEDDELRVFEAQTSLCYAMKDRAAWSEAIEDYWLTGAGEKAKIKGLHGALWCRDITLIKEITNDTPANS